MRKWLQEKEREYAAVDSESDDDHGATAARNEGNPPNNKNVMSNDGVSFKTVYVYVFYLIKKHKYLYSTIFKFLENADWI